MFRARKLLLTMPRTPGRPRCEGAYQPPHPEGGKRCVSSSRYTIDGKYYCTTHAWGESLRILLEENDA
jgi:hypothetical protein